MTRTIIDLSDLSPQTTFLQSSPAEPDPRSTLYLDKRLTTNHDGSQSYTLVGVHVVIEAGNSSGLWEILHVDRTSNRIDPTNPRMKLCSLVVICDTLEIHGALSLPETAVTIHARRLIWADASASIDTSPLQWTQSKAADATERQPGGNGAHGRHAGALDVLVDEVISAGGTTRIFARGGRGQDPGSGLDGEDGESRISRTDLTASVRSLGLESKARISFDPPAIFVEYQWS